MITISQTAPLRAKLQANGNIRTQGIFTWYDEQGFPIAMAYEMCKEKGHDIDWIEALADALRQCIFKYDKLVQEINMLETEEKFNTIMTMFKMMLMDCEGETASNKASHLYSKFWTDPKN